MLTDTAPALRLELLTRYAESRRETDQLFSILAPSSLYARPIPERHRIVFYIGHLEAFDWNLLRNHLALDRFNAEFDQLFAFGIDPVDGGLPNDPPDAWPSMSDVESYRDRVREQLDGALGEAAESAELVELMNIAIEHRLMHAETLEYMFHQLPYEAKIRPALQPIPAARTVTPAMVEVPAGTAALGLERNSGQFGWDNEFEFHRVEVPAFLIDKYKITNGQFAKFMEDGGYSRQALWSPADWDWKGETESRIQCSGFSASKAVSVTALCSTKFRWRPNVRCMSATPKRAPTLVGPAKPCQRKRSGNAPPRALSRRNLPARYMIRRLAVRRRSWAVFGEWKIYSEPVGSGPPLNSHPFPASELRPPIQAIPPIFSMANTSL